MFNLKELFGEGASAQFAQTGELFQQGLASGFRFGQSEEGVFIL